MLPVLWFLFCALMITIIWVLLQSYLDRRERDRVSAIDSGSDDPIEPEKILNDPQALSSKDVVEWDVLYFVPELLDQLRQQAVRFEVEGDGHVEWSIRGRQVSRLDDNRILIWEVSVACSSENPDLYQGTLVGQVEL